jgi:hypothetical protein
MSPQGTFQGSGSADRRVSAKRFPLLGGVLNTRSAEARTACQALGFEPCTWPRIFVEIGPRLVL